MRPEIKRILSYFSERSEVAALFMFGSFDMLKEREDSDIDIAVLITPESVQNKKIEDFKSEYYHASAGFSLRTIDIVILNTAPSFLKHYILKTGRILFDKKPSYRKEFTARAIQEYFDYRPIEETYFKALRMRLSTSVHKYG